MVWVKLIADIQELAVKQFLLASMEGQRLPDEFMEYLSFYVKFLPAAHLAADIRRYRKNCRGIAHHGMRCIVPLDASVEFHL